MTDEYRAHARKPPKNRPSRSWVVVNLAPSSEIVTIESIESVFIRDGIRYSFRTVPKNRSYDK
jgi:hypothetical protein